MTSLRGHSYSQRCFAQYSKIYRYLDRNAFVDAIAPSTDLKEKIARAQYAVLFKVADKSKRGLVSWDDFAVFQTILKRPDADYWIAFQYFDVYARIYVIYKLKMLIITMMRRDESGTITFDEFKNVFSSNLGPDSIPFDFNWCAKMQRLFR